MNKRIVCIAENGQETIFSEAFPYFLTDVTGIHEMVGNVVTAKSANSIGAIYQGTAIEPRNIIITGSFKKKLNVDGRMGLYAGFPLRSWGTFYYYENNLARKIDYQVERVTVIRSAVYHTFAISLICPNPNFTDITETIVYLSDWQPMFEFPIDMTESGFIFGDRLTSLIATINNKSDYEIGFTLECQALNTVKNPYLLNIDNGEIMGVDLIMNPKDRLIFTTYRRNKNIIYITELGVTTNINNHLQINNNFFNLKIGENNLRVGAETGEADLLAKIRYLNEYGAV